jgi:hypothetical protein
LLLAVPELLATTGDADVLDVPLAAPEDPLALALLVADGGALLEDGAALLMLLLAGALLLARALLLAGALLVALALLLALLDEALRLRLGLLPTDELFPLVGTEPTGANEVEVAVGFAETGLLEPLVTAACPGSSDGLLSAGCRTSRKPPVATAATSKTAAAASGPRLPSRLGGGRSDRSCRASAAAAGLAIKAVSSSGSTTSPGSGAAATGVPESTPASPALASAGSPD